MKKKIIIGSIIVILIAAVVAANILKNNGAIPAFGGGKILEVKAGKIEKGNISSAISASSVVEEIEKSEIFFDTPLKVKRLYVEKNQRVTRGQKLVELDLDTLNSELEQARVNRSIQELALQKIKPGGSDSAAENSLKMAEIAYEDSRKSYENSKALYSTGAISQNDYDKAEKAFKDADISLKNARLGISNQSVDFRTQEQNLRSTILRISDIETKLKKINDLVVSSIDGMIADVSIVEGGFTSSSQPSFKIVNPDKLRIKAEVKEFDLKNVAVGQDVRIYGDAIDKVEGVSGKVSSISPVAKKKMNTSNVEETLVEVMVAIEKSHPILKPGLSVTCDIVTRSKENALIATFEMLREDKDGNRNILVFDPKDGIIREKKVKLGITSELSAEVVEGVNEGDMAILEPQPNYKDGSRAKLKKEDKK